MGIHETIRRGIFVALAALAILIPVAIPGQGQEIMPVSQIKIGMKGYGLTVFKGTKIERFNFEVLGVLKKQNLGGDLVLIMMSGGPITTRGANIIAGMSGSPVYINGKLVGAVSYGMTFPKEPIAMVTPIQDMLETLDPKLEKTPPSKLSPLYTLDKPVKVGERLIDKVTLDGKEPKAASEGDTLGMVPLSTPVMVAGASPRSLRFLNNVLQNAQIEPVAGPGTAAVQGEVPLVPGSAVGVQLMRGDIDMTGIGTLTYRKGNKVLAFGHPMMQLGTVDMPMTTGYIYDIFCGVMRSSKMGAPIKAVGSINQDRPWAIGGTVGKYARMVPVSCEVKDLGSGRTKTIKVEIIDHPALTPSLILTAADQGILEVHPNITDSMARVKMEISSESFPSITRENVFFDPQAIDAAALKDVIQALSILTMNPNFTDKIKQVNLKVEVWDKRQTAQVQKISVNKTKYEPGETVQVNVQLKPYKQEEINRTLSLKIPETAPNGSMTLTVSGGGTSIQTISISPDEQEKSSESVIVMGAGGGTGMDVSEMIKRFMEREKNNDLVGKLILSGPGVNIRGEKLLGLPATVAEVYRSPKASGVRNEREEIKTVEPTEWVLSGAQTLSLTIQRKGKAEKSSGSKSESSSSSSSTSSSSSSSSSSIDTLSDSDFEFSTQPNSDLISAAAQESDKTKSEEVKSDKSSDTKMDSAKADDKKDDAKITDIKPDDDKSTTKTVVRQASKWTNTTQSDFEQGSGPGTAVTSDGDVRLTRSLKLNFDTKEPYAWSVATCQGKAYVGTGNGGKIYQIDSTGKAELFAETKTLEVQALAAGSDGTLYAATAPDAVIYRIGQNKEVTKLYDAAERYVFALVAGKDGNLYAATGGGAAHIYKISPDGKAELLFSSPESHILSLIQGSDGALYAGTGESGIVYRIASNGKADVVYDAAESNITSLAQDAKGNLYAGTGTKGVLYRIAPDGRVKKLSDKFKSTISSLAVDPAGNVLAASGSFVYQISPDDTVTAFDEVSGAQFQSLALDQNGNLYAASSNPGQVYLSGAEGSSAVYESSTHDAGSVARWGRMTWDTVTPEGTSISMRTRSGNTAEPDETWSEWSSAADGSITSPAARYIQYQATLSASRSEQTPSLNNVTLSYLPKNQAPTLSVTAPAANTAWSKKQTVKWTATDPDKDLLTTDLFYSSDNGQSWKSLGTVDKEATYSWDTTMVPDGVYQLKLVVSDRKSNPDDAQSIEKLTDSVIICNKAPVLTYKVDQGIQTDKKLNITGQASSRMVPIVGVEWQVNGNGWAAASPVDGIYDSSYEQFRLTTDSLPSGQNNVEVKATDAAGNSTTEKIPVKVP